MDAPTDKPTNLRRSMTCIGYRQAGPICFSSPFPHPLRSDVQICLLLWAGRQTEYEWMDDAPSPPHISPPLCRTQHLTAPPHASAQNKCRQPCRKRGVEWRFLPASGAATPENPCARLLFFETSDFGVWGYVCTYSTIRWGQLWGVGGEGGLMLNMPRDIFSMLALL